MTRKIWLLLVLILAALLLFGCAEKETAQTSVFDLQLSEEKKQEILSAVSDAYIPPPYRWAQHSDAPGEYTYGGFRYYGTFGDAIVWMAADETSNQVSGCSAGYAIMTHPCESEMYIYVDGENYLLEHAVDRGQLSADDMLIVAKRHWTYNKAVESAQETTVLDTTE